MAFLLKEQKCSGVSCRQVYFLNISQVQSIWCDSDFISCDGVWDHLTISIKDDSILLYRHDVTFFNWIIFSIQIQLKFVFKSSTDHMPTLVKIMALYRAGDKPLSYQWWSIIQTDICVRQPQWSEESIFAGSMNFLHISSQHFQRIAITPVRVYGLPAVHIQYSLSYW